MVKRARRAEMKTQVQPLALGFGYYLHSYSDERGLLLNNMRSRRGVAQLPIAILMPDEIDLKGGRFTKFRFRKFKHTVLAEREILVATDYGPAVDFFCNRVQRIWNARSYVDPDTSNVFLLFSFASQEDAVLFQMLHGGIDQSHLE